MRHAEKCGITVDPECGFCTCGAGDEPPREQQRLRTALAAAEKRAEAAEKVREGRRVTLLEVRAEQVADWKRAERAEAERDAGRAARLWAEGQVVVMRGALSRSQYVLREAVCCTDAEGTLEEVTNVLADTEALARPWLELLEAAEAALPILGMAQIVDEEAAAARKRFRAAIAALRAYSRNLTPMDFSVLR